MKKVESRRSLYSCRQIESHHITLGSILLKIIQIAVEQGAGRSAGNLVNPVVSAVIPDLIAERGNLLVGIRMNDDAFADDGGFQLFHKTIVQFAFSFDLDMEGDS